MLLAHTLDAAIPLFGAAIAGWYGWRAPVLAASDRRWKEWDARWGRLCRIAAPILIAVSLLKILLKLA